MKTPDFSIVNLTGRYEILPNAFFSAEVSNLFNRAYSEHLNRAYSTKHGGSWSVAEFLISVSRMRFDLVSSGNRSHAISF